MIDVSWLPRPYDVIAVHAKAKIAHFLTNLAGINLEGDLATMNAHEFYWVTSYQLQEDEAWFGLIGFLLIFPTSLIAFIRGWKKKNLLLVAPFLFLLTTMVTATLIRPGWTPYDGRYFMPLAALSAPLLPMWFQGKKTGKWLQYIVLVVSLLSMVMVVRYNPAKGVLGDSAIWGMNRIDRLTRQSYTSKEMLYLVEAAIPEDAVVGVATDYTDYQEYGIFGEQFRRKIVNVYPPERVSDADWLAQRGVHYLLILVTENYPQSIADGFHYVDSLADWVVYSDVGGD